MKTIQTPNAPQAIGPYSQAVEVNGFIFCSGQIGIDPQTNMLVDGIEKQTQQVLNNIDGILKSVGLDKTCIVKTTVFLKSIDDFAVMNNIYANFFGDHKPARSTIEVSNLPKKALIEIEIIAKKK